MDPARAFDLLNLAVLPWWALWLLAPRSAWAIRAASHSAVFAALALLYAGLLVAGISAGGLGGFGYEDIRAGLASPLGMLAGWTHFLAFDLFVGAWIVRESALIDVEPRPFLFFTLMTGPIGLGAFLVRRALRVRSWGDLGGDDPA